MPAVRRADYVQDNGHDEIVEICAEGFDGLLTWRSARTLHLEPLSIDFIRIDPAPPFLSMRGVWTFLPHADGCIVRLDHEFELSDDGALTKVLSVIGSNVTRDLEGMKSFLEHNPRRRTALVTGGSSGIGLEIARSMLSAGNYCVLIGARDTKRLRSACLDLRNDYPDAQVLDFSVDVTDTESVRRFFAYARQKFSQIDILVNNAGIGGGGRTADLPESHWLEILDTNLNGVYRCTAAYLAEAQQRKLSWGRIVNIASTGGKQGVVHAAAYCSSKHAVVGFSKSLGLEYAKSGITVNAVCPGFVETDLAVGARERYAAINHITPEEMKSRIENRIPIGRYIRPEEVAACVAFLLGDAAGGITAQAINVCGGLGNY